MIAEGQLIFHHTGIAVYSIEDAKKSYAELFGYSKFSKTFVISTQKVNVCFLEVGENVFLEFVEPSSNESSIHRFLKKGINCYHTAYKCDEIDIVVDELILKNFHSLGFFNSEAFENKRCIFLISPEGHLIELIEK